MKIFPSLLVLSLLSTLSFGAKESVRNRSGMASLRGARNDATLLAAEQVPTATAQEIDIENQHEVTVEKKEHVSDRHDRILTRSKGQEKHRMSHRSIAAKKTKDPLITRHRHR